MTIIISCSPRHHRCQLQFPQLTPSSSLFVSVTSHGVKHEWDLLSQCNKAHKVIFMCAEEPKHRSVSDKSSFFQLCATAFDFIFISCILVKTVAVKSQ